MQFNKTGDPTEVTIFLVLHVFDVTRQVITPHHVQTSQTVTQIRTLMLLQPLLAHDSAVGSLATTQTTVQHLQKNVHEVVLWVLHQQDEI